MRVRIVNLLNKQLRDTEGLITYAPNLPDAKKVATKSILKKADDDKVEKTEVKLYHVLCD